MILGYARTSTADQQAGFDAQKAELIAAGAERIFSEQVSSVQHRAQLSAALEFAREGDVLLVTKADRLARNTAQLLGIVDALTARKVGLVILSMGEGPFDTRNATARLTLEILAAVAAFERSIMLERQREGIAAAKAEGKYKGRPPSIARDRVEALKAGGMGAAAIAKELGIGRASVYRLLGETLPTRP